MSSEGKPEISRTSANSARAEKSYGAKPEELQEAVRRAASNLDRWEMTGEAELVRTTKLLRFKDDITLEISASGTGSRLVANSASRLGKGDFGQNPKNLQELFSAVDHELGL